MSEYKLQRDIYHGGGKICKGVRYDTVEMMLKNRLSAWVRESKKNKTLQDQNQAQAEQIAKLKEERDVLYYKVHGRKYGELDDWGRVS